MTYRYCELAVGRNLPVRSDGIRWAGITDVVPVNSKGIEIPVATPEEDMRLWNKQVVGFEIQGNLIYVRLGV